VSRHRDISRGENQDSQTEENEKAVDGDRDENLSLE